MAESERRFGTTGTTGTSGAERAAPEESREEPGREQPWEGRVLRANTRRDDDAAGGQPHDPDDGLPERTPSGAALWFWWTVATVLGWALAGACVGAFFDADTATPLQYVFVPLTALFQWLVLRRHFARASWWLLATVLGSAVAGLIYAGLLTLPEATFGAATSGLRSGLSDLTDGFALAAAQWLVLRRSVRGAERWIPALVSPLAIFGWLDFQRGKQAAETLDFLTIGDRIGLAATNTAILGLLIGALTGALLMRLVEEPKSED